MRSALAALRPAHWLGIGLVAAVLGGGIPSNWFGLVGSKVTEVERLRACLERHSVEMTALVEGLGDPQTVLSGSPAARAHSVRVAEPERRLNRREGHAIVECARTVTG